MKDFEIIGSADQIRSLASEQRLQILRQLVEEPLTATMVAARLGRPVNQVHYHIQQLVEQSLIQEVPDPRRVRKGERYYRTAARQFLVDPGLTCPDDALSSSVRESIEVSALHWRRREILDLDLRQVARRVVTDCLRVTRDEKVLVVFAPTALEPAEALLVELQAAGAETRTKIWSRNIILQTLDRHTAESLPSIPFIHPDQDRDLDAMILVTSSLPQGSAPHPGQREKLPLLLEAVARWQRSLRERNVRTLEMSLPHRGEFEGGWTTPEEAIDVYWKCLDADVEHLREQGQGLVRTIGDRSRWHITDGRGTDFTFAMLPGDVRISDGVIDDDDIARGMPDDVLPAGQLMGLPQSSSASGSIWADYTYLLGKHYYDVRLVIREGRIVEARTRDDADSLLARIREESGDPDLFAGITIGLNPGGQVLTGKASLDAALSGVVTISFGNNELDGGTVNATLTVNLPSRSMTVVVEDRTLVAAGILINDSP